MGCRTLAADWIGHMRTVVCTVEVYSIPTVWKGYRQDHYARIAVCRWIRKRRRTLLSGSTVEDGSSAECRICLRGHCLRVAHQNPETRGKWLYYCPCRSAYPAIIKCRIARRSLGEN